MALLLAAGAASAGVTPQPDPAPMGWQTFQPRGWDKYHDTNRMLSDRCRDQFAGMVAFAGKPLSEVRPNWRRTKLDRLNAKRERISGKSSLCWPAHHSLWLCIHEGEGDWEDGGDPYWGGLQMDRNFITAYLRHFAPGSDPPHGYVGPNGWSNAASQYAQETAAEYGYRASGYSAAWIHGKWPVSSLSCGEHLA